VLGVRPGDLERDVIGVVRVAGGRDLLRAVLTIEEEKVTFGGGTYLGLRSWEVDIEGGLPLGLLGTMTAFVFLRRGHRLVLSGEAVVTDIRVDVDALVDRPLRYIRSCRLLGNGPLVLGNQVEYS
jgi:hypothetical protein